MLIGIVFIISVGSFYLIHLLRVISPRSSRARARAPRTRQNSSNSLVSTDPIYEQYFTWIGNVLHGNLGVSFISQTSVAGTIRAALADRPRNDPPLRSSRSRSPSPSPCVGAQARWLARSHVFSAGSFTLLSVPPFIIIVILVLIVSVKLGIAPYRTFVVRLLKPRLDRATSKAWRCPRLPSRWAVSSCTSECCEATSSPHSKKSSSPWPGPRASASDASCGATPFDHRQSPCSAAAGINIGGLLAGGFIVQYLLDIPGLGYTLIRNQRPATTCWSRALSRWSQWASCLINFIFDFIINIVDPRISRE
jgi:ABC-type dipeptide/oligopeptide/nickel transport system permease component